MKPEHVDLGLSQKVPSHDSTNTVGLCHFCSNTAHYNKECCANATVTRCQHLLGFAINRTEHEELAPIANDYNRVMDDHPGSMKLFGRELTCLNGSHLSVASLVGIILGSCLGFFIIFALVLLLWSRKLRLFLGTSAEVSTYGGNWVEKDRVDSPRGLQLRFNKSPRNSTHKKPNKLIFLLRRGFHILDSCTEKDSNILNLRTVARPNLCRTSESQSRTSTFSAISDYSHESSLINLFQDCFSLQQIRLGDIVVSMLYYEAKQEDEYYLFPGERLQVLFMYADGWATGRKLANSFSFSSQVENSGNAVDQSQVKIFPLYCVCHERAYIRERTPSLSH